MDADVSISTPASCRTRNIGAKYPFEVHWLLLFGVLTKEFAREPLFFQIYPSSTLLCCPTQKDGAFIFIT
jgi:hypothetical protein